MVLIVDRNDFVSQLKCVNANVLKCNTRLKTSIDVLPSKNQALGEYCTHVSNY